MTPDKIIVTVVGIGLIMFIYWFFLMKKRNTVKVSGKEIDILVEGGYNPESISIPVGKTTTIHFKRTDPSDCLSEVVLSDFKIRKKLPLNETVSINISPTSKGTYRFSCGMNMYHGTVEVN